MPPLVSICLPNLNNRRFLEPRMESIMAQTMADWELIVCDSYSDDGAWEYFQAFAGDQRVQLHQVPREGIYAGWNECLRRACGKYVYIATSDDTMAPECLEKLSAALEKAESVKPKAENETKSAPHVPLSTSYVPRPTLQAPRLTSYLPPSPLNPLPPDIAVCNFDYIDACGKVIEPPLPPAGAFYGADRFRAHRRSGYLEFLVHLLIGTSWTTMTAVLFRRALLEKTGLFRADVPGALADRLWAYRSALHADTLVVPETLATWRQHPRQGSAPQGGRRRTLRQMRDRRRLWRAIVETVRVCESRLPATWRCDPDLIDKLLWAERRHYYDLYALSRTHLRHNPRQFAVGLLCAALLEPGYLARRLGSGLAWPPDHAVSESEYLKRLITVLSGTGINGRLVRQASKTQRNEQLS